MSGVQILIQERARRSITTEEICKMNLDESYYKNHCIFYITVAVNLTEYKETFDDVTVS